FPALAYCCSRSCGEAPRIGLAVDGHRDAISFPAGERIPHHHYHFAERPEDRTAMRLSAGVGIRVAFGVVGAGRDYRASRRASRLSKRRLANLRRDLHSELERDRRRKRRIARARRYRIRPFTSESRRLDGRAIRRNLDRLGQRTTTGKRQGRVAGRIERRHASHSLAILAEPRLHELRTQQLRSLEWP